METFIIVSLQHKFSTCVCNYRIFKYGSKWTTRRTILLIANSISPICSKSSMGNHIVNFNYVYANWNISFQIFFLHAVVFDYFICFGLTAIK